MAVVEVVSFFCSLLQATRARTTVDAIAVRTSSFFSPWDYRDFVAQTIDALKGKREMEAASDLVVSPTYLPDLVTECLNLLLDNESGIVHVVNEGSVTWAGFAEKVAAYAGVELTNVSPVPDEELG
ncbi:MAG: dTDP-4-dehydrorhamnose reductase, partial [Sphingobacteriales bacterium]